MKSGGQVQSKVKTRNSRLNMYLNNTIDDPVTAEHNRNLIECETPEYGLSIMPSVEITRFNSLENSLGSTPAFTNPKQSTTA